MVPVLPPLNANSAAHKLHLTFSFPHTSILVKKFDYGDFLPRPVSFAISLNMNADEETAGKFPRALRADARRIIKTIRGMLMQQMAGKMYRALRVGRRKTTTGEAWSGVITPKKG
ncbi:hypothetical protein DPMN_174034 [Dreissena polymorpha]|uniref:Uncharacterized protein n=1 Tax=Dreissena polymorpha TaxID=45954 RepID=A0A9D4E5H3_DREPO|nr:hypothetical protein DPMN_174034 [Dreissena polymorpha]